MQMLKKFLATWARDEDATTAIEFSLLAIPYVFLTVGIIELAITYTTASLLEGATSSAARLVRTGQVQQTDGDPEEMFRTALCEYASALIDCEDIAIEVVTLDSFSDAEDMAPQFDEDGNLIPRAFDAGGSSDRILIRAVHNYDMMTPLVGPLLAGPDNSIMFMSTIVLEVEPYDFEGEI